MSFLWESLLGTRRFRSFATRSLSCSSFLVMTCFLLRRHNIIPKKELHSILCIVLTFDACMEPLLWPSCFLKVGYDVVDLPISTGILGLLGATSRCTLALATSQIILVIPL